jgi:hypothetical protein
MMMMMIGAHTRSKTRTKYEKKKKRVCGGLFAGDDDGLVFICGVAQKTRATQHRTCILLMTCLLLFGIFRKRRERKKKTPKKKKRLCSNGILISMIGFN